MLQCCRIVVTLQSEFGRTKSVSQSPRLFSLNKQASNGNEYIFVKRPCEFTPLFKVLEQMHARLVANSTSVIMSDAVLNVMHLHWSKATWPKARVVRTDCAGYASDVCTFTTLELLAYAACSWHVPRCVAFIVSGTTPYEAHMPFHNLTRNI